MEISLIPRFLLERLSLSPSNRTHANILISSVLIIAAVATLKVMEISLASFPHVCAFQYLFGAPCPGCGVIRSIEAAATGCMMDAWAFNPAGLIFFWFLVAQIPMRIAAIRYPRSNQIICTLSGYGNRCVIASLLIVWIMRLIY